MIRTAYRLNPKPGSGLHLGREGLDQETSAESFPSDSFFSALIATLVTVDPDVVTEFMAQWPQGDPVSEPPFRLSSLFPIAGDLPLLPMPRLRANLGNEQRTGIAKALKQLAYVSPAILERLLTGAPLDAWLPEDGGPAKKGLMLQDGKVWISREEVELLPPPWQKFGDKKLHDTPIWKVQPVPRVAVDRVTNRSNIFQVGRTVFAEGCGLWMLADINREGALLEKLLDVISDEGIGGERSSGYGTFHWRRIDAPALPSADRTNHVMALSRYNPTPGEWEAGVLGAGASYELVDIGGWMAAPGLPAQRRKRVRLIEAGSVLVNTGPVTGRIVDVRPEYDQEGIGAPAHPVYRSGIALVIGVPGGTDG